MFHTLSGGCDIGSSYETVVDWVLYTQVLRLWPCGCFEWQPVKCLMHANSCRYCIEYRSVLFLSRYRHCLEHDIGISNETVRVWEL